MEFEDLSQLLNDCDCSDYLSAFKSKFIHIIKLKIILLL